MGKTRIKTCVLLWGKSGLRGMDADVLGRRKGKVESGFGVA